MYFLQPGQKRLITSFNPVFVGLFVLVLILIRTTSEPVIPAVLRQWDLLLPAIIYVGQRRGLFEGLLLVLFLSHLYSLCSAAPIGVFVVHYLLIFALARLLIYVIYANNWLSVSGLILFLSFISRILLPIVAKAFGHSWSIVSFQNFVWWSLLINTFVGFIVYAFLGTLDRLTYKAPPSNIELDEN